MENPKIQLPGIGKDLHPLESGYFFPDEKKLVDFLKFINKLAKEVKFFGPDSGGKNDWFQFFISDELFLLAEIESFNLSQFEKEKTDILLQFERSNREEDKIRLYSKLLDQVRNLILILDSWYLMASKYNKNRESGTLERELASAIGYRGSELYYQLRFLIQSFNKELPNKLPEWKDLELSGIWSSSKKSIEQAFYGTELLQMDYLFKQTILLQRPLIKTFFSLMERSRILFHQNLISRQDHEPHIGLLLAFFKLIEKLQQEFNTVPERLLHYYFSEILDQKKINQVPDTTYAYAILDPDFSELILPSNTLVLAGQNRDGQDRIYSTVESAVFSNSILSRVYTLFISRNPLIDPGSSFQTVNGIYAQKINPSTKYNAFHALGEDQRFLSQEARSMEEVQLGFGICSPTLRLKGGDRKTSINFNFQPDGFHLFLTYLLSIAKERSQKPEEVFFLVFSKAFQLLYTSYDGWAQIQQFEIIPPENWNDCSFKLMFELDPSMPEFVPYQEEIHQEGMNLNQPTLKVLIINQQVFHPYSFLQFLKLDSIKIEVEVKNLKNLALHSNYGPLDPSIPFDLLGPSPKPGSFLLIGNDELFSKDLIDLKIGWSFFGLPMDSDLEEYFRAYPYGIKNDSFKLQVQALSDFRFYPDKAFTDSDRIDLFETDENLLLPYRLLQNIPLKSLKISPNYNFDILDPGDIPLSAQTGFIKLELVAPSMGFGFDVYSEVYNKSVAYSTNKQLEKPKSGFSFEVPKEPFSPQATNLFLEYKAESEISFIGNKSFANDPDKGECFYQIHPFGNKFQLKNGKVIEADFLPFFELQGAIFLGIEVSSFPKELNVLFEVTKNEAWSYGDAPVLDWFYLSSDEWKPFNQSDLLYDTTFGLTRSGIISFKKPQDINRTNHIMADSFFWICCRTLNHAELASSISGIYLNGFATQAVLKEGIHHDPILPAFSIQSFSENIPGVLEIIQPLPSFDGREEESDESFFLRVSKSLRHKFRAVTKWDIENMLLNHFPWLGFVRIFGNFQFEQFVQPGTITLVGIPKIYDDSVFYQPKLSPGQIKELEIYLKSILNPFISFKIINPSYEFLLIKGQIKFTSEDSGILLKKLYSDLLEIICPWFYQDLGLIFNSSENIKSEILNFILTRPYVKFFTGYSIAHLYKNDLGESRLRDSTKEENGMDTLKVSSPWSVIIPYALKNLEIIAEEYYSPPQAFDLTDFSLGENFVISSGAEHAGLFSEEINTQMESKSEESFHFTFKF